MSAGRHWTSHGGFVAGKSNTAGGGHASVTGVSDNNASGNYSSVVVGDRLTVSSHGSIAVGKGNWIGTG